MHLHALCRQNVYLNARSPKSASSRSLDFTLAGIALAERDDGCLKQLLCWVLNKGWTPKIFLQIVSRKSVSCLNEMWITMALRGLTRLFFLVVDAARCRKELVLFRRIFLSSLDKGQQRNCIRISKKLFLPYTKRSGRRPRRNETSTMYPQETPPGGLSKQYMQDSQLLRIRNIPCQTSRKTRSKPILNQV